MKEILLSAIICALNLTTHAHDLAASPETKEQEGKLISASWLSRSSTDTVLKNNPKQNDYSEWLFIQSDKALQFRYKLMKTEKDIGYFQVQFRINFEDQIFCSHPTCMGYLLSFSYPAYDNQTNIYTSYKFYNTFKGVYTIPELVPIRLDFPDGSKRIPRPDGFYYTTANDKTEQRAYVFYNCVDNILSNSPDHRCRDFKDAEAIVVK